MVAHRSPPVDRLSDQLCAVWHIAMPEPRAAMDHPTQGVTHGQGGQARCRHWGTTHQVKMAVWKTAPYTSIHKCAHGNTTRDPWQQLSLQVPVSTWWRPTAKCPPLSAYSNAPPFLSVGNITCHGFHWCLIECIISHPVVIILHSSAYLCTVLIKGCQRDLPKWP